MDEPVSTIPNLGPASEKAYAKAGIHSAGALRDMGADRAYLALITSGHPAHFIGYYCLVMGLQGRVWNDCKGAEKAALRQRFDRIKALAKGNIATGDLPHSLYQALDLLGVIEKTVQKSCQKK